MTIASTISKATYTTSSAVMDYAYNFKILNAGQLRVTVVNSATGDTADLILTSDYSVTGVGLADGGAVRLTAAGQAKAGAGNKLVILRNMEFTQETDYRAHEVFPAETHETALDILTMMCQELREKLSRAIIRNPDEEESIPYHEIVEVVEKMEAYKAAAEESAGKSAQSAAESKQAATEAKTARTQSQTAQGKAEAARDLAQSYANEGKGYRDQAGVFAGNAAGSASQSGTFRNQAEGFAAAAGQSAAAALSYRDQARTAAGESEASRGQSQGFAEDAARSAAAAQKAQEKAEEAQGLSEGAAGQALNSANSAKDFADAAKISETNAAESAATAKSFSDKTIEIASNFESDIGSINDRLDQTETDIDNLDNRLGQAETEHDDGLAHLLFAAAITASQGLISTTTNGIELFKLGGYQ